MRVYLVGGAVRDMIMGVKSKDYDYVIVNASQADLDQLQKDGFKQVGADFPVFLDPINGHEYALARTERKVGQDTPALNARPKMSRWSRILCAAISP